MYEKVNLEFMYINDPILKKTLKKDKKFHYIYHETFVTYVERN